MNNAYAPCMNTDTAAPGKKVVYTGGNGREFDHKSATDAGLIPGMSYTLAESQDEGWSTNVYLRETADAKFPSGKPMYFNSVIFADVDDWKAHVAAM